MTGRGLSTAFGGAVSDCSGVGTDCFPDRADRRKHTSGEADSIDMAKQRSRHPDPEPFTVPDAQTIIASVQRTGSARLLTRRLNDLRFAVPLYQSLGAAG